MSTPAEADGESSGPARGLRGWLGVYARGALMGVAELVPGVSGGTIAFVTGIYDELVNTLAGLKPSSLALVRHGLIAGFLQIWRTHNLSFLLVLGVGMVTSVVLLAQALTMALAAYRPVVWGFFLGIIVLSVWVLGRHLPAQALLRFAPLGVLVGVAVTVADPLAGRESLPVFFLAGAVAVSAWLLPAVSGSFILLVLGLYEPVIGAVASPGWDVLIVFLAGCVTGLLLFARILSWALYRVRSQLMSFLTGFMAGASLQLWPWQSGGRLLSPMSYGAVTGEDAYLAATLVSLGLGALVIWLLGRLETRPAG